MKYYIIAGEASGDLHGSNLMKGLYSCDPAADVRFRGGDLMLAVHDANQCGSGLAAHFRDGAVMGFTDVIKKAGKLGKALGECKKDILAWNPDVVILIDYPGFNMKIAGFCHKQGIRVFYYIAPKTWASRERRNRKLKEYVDKLFIVFPFEIPYFTKAGVPFIYKGNPLIDSVDNAVCGKVSDKPYVAILPGSRKGEISRMMPVCMGVVDELSSDPAFSGYEFIVAGAPARSESDYREYIDSRSNVRLIFGKTPDILKNACCAVINSGTASLEAALFGTPQVVCWSSTRLTMFVALHVLRVQDRISFISLGNLILGREAFPELIQEAFTRENVCSWVRKLAFDRQTREKMKGEYSLIRENLGGRGASRAVAEAMIKCLREFGK